MDDNEEVVETKSNFDGDQVMFPDVGVLVPIEDEDPRAAALEVERAMEREELWRRHLTMDDQAWCEAMEMEQLSRVDPVPGYIPAPLYSDSGED